MAKIKMVLFAAVLLAAAAAHADYNSCRCALTAPGIDIPGICCPNNYADCNTQACGSKGNPYAYYGFDGDTRCCAAGKTWVNAAKTCKTACPAVCPAGQIRTAYQYSEDGACCQTAAVCTPNSTQPCGACGMQTCNSAGTAWGDCIETPRPDGRQDCGTCGIQTRTTTCDKPTAKWTAGTWEACTAHYVFHTVCCTPPADFTTQCKPGGGSWATMLPACGYSGNPNPDVDCREVFEKIDPFTL